MIERPLPRRPVFSSEDCAGTATTVRAVLTPSRYWNPGVGDEVFVTFTGRHWSTVCRPSPYYPANGRIVGVEKHISFSPAKTTYVATVELFPGLQPPEDWEGLLL